MKQIIRKQVPGGLVHFFSLTFIRTNASHLVQCQITAEVQNLPSSPLAACSSPTFPQCLCSSRKRDSKMHHSVLASQIFVYFFFSDEEKWNVEKLTIQVWTDSE